MDAQQAAAVATASSAFAARQRLLAAEWARDLVALVRRVFRPADPAESWPGTQIAVSALVQRRHRDAADLAARYYLDVRRASGIAPERRPASAPSRGADVGLSEDEAWAELERLTGVRPSDLDDDRVDVVTRATGIASYERSIRLGRDPRRAGDTMTATLAGGTQTLVLEGARGTVLDAVLADDEAIGWARVTDADPCAFCSMMASRGAVFRDEGTAGRAANKRFVGDGMFKWHNHCGCSAVPVFDPDDPVLRVADELYERWLRQTRGHSGKAALKAWTQYWDGLEPADKPTAAPADETS